ncbi:STAS domain-containing protein [Stutzerimonas kirkiae]|uniref:Anti-anti-sigma factor n=1 Tax=Stutzerimonas kirkiae TaxID=2211392 RepID=A0A4Q9RCK4_9GAMM|nr:STAS domain-containing protein [Stutzerimonas kirkiae]TBU98919.1 anti-anti-sigma factor [Stutzerimonas kirkiae]TBV01569.1 anti-anti-sigma factor [Stutzerimonas kirkiae]TBV10327.1 anti-anti-sigma factor [Stutzerimonas kirkiae]TBV16880.1 anti-anti-sigma factor [Stutzerimonas kirkiae]
MSEGHIALDDQGRLLLGGVLDHRSGPELRKAGQALLRSTTRQALVLDCSGVSYSSSVGLSLLLAFTRDARAFGRELRITGLTPDMSKIASVSGLADVLALEPATPA